MTASQIQAWARSCSSLGPRVADALLAQDIDGPALRDIAVSANAPGHRVGVAAALCSALHVTLGMALVILREVDHSVQQK
jgi:hypothetical protein